MQRDENIEGMEVQKRGVGERDSEKQMYIVEMRDKGNWSKGQLERNVSHATKENLFIRYPSLCSFLSKALFDLLKIYDFYFLLFCC